MDKVVVDSSVAIKWFVVEPFSTEARRIFDSYRGVADKERIYGDKSPELP